MRKSRSKSVEDYLALPYSTYVMPDVTTDGQPCYVAYHPELEGCMSHGATREEALRNLREATELYISTLLEKGIDFPLPAYAPGAPSQVELEITFEVAGQVEVVHGNVFASPPIAPPVFVHVT